MQLDENKENCVVLTVEERQCFCISIVRDADSFHELIGCLKDCYSRSVSDSRYATSFSIMFEHFTPRLIPVIISMNLSDIEEPDLKLLLTVLSSNNSYLRPKMLLSFVQWASYDEDTRYMTQLVQLADCLASTSLRRSDNLFHSECLTVLAKISSDIVFSQLPCATHLTSSIFKLLSNKYKLESIESAVSSIANFTSSISDPNLSNSIINYIQTVVLSPKSTISIDSIDSPFAIHLANQFGFYYLLAMFYNQNIATNEAIKTIESNKLNAKERYAKISNEKIKNYKTKLTTFLHLMTLSSNQNIYLWHAFSQQYSFSLPLNLEEIKSKSIRKYEDAIIEILTNLLTNATKDSIICLIHACRISSLSSLSLWSFSRCVCLFSLSNQHPSSNHQLNDALVELYGTISVKYLNDRRMNEFISILLNLSHSDEVCAHCSSVHSIKQTRLSKRLFPAEFIQTSFRSCFIRYLSTTITSQQVHELFRVLLSSSSSSLTSRILLEVGQSLRMDLQLGDVNEILSSFMDQTNLDDVVRMTGIVKLYNQLCIYCSDVSETHMVTIIKWFESIFMSEKTVDLLPASRLLLAMCGLFSCHLQHHSTIIIDFDYIKRICVNAISPLLSQLADMDLVDWIASPFFILAVETSDQELKDRLVLFIVHQISYQLLSEEVSSAFVKQLETSSSCHDLIISACVDKTSCLNSLIIDDDDCNLRSGCLIDFIISSYSENCPSEVQTCTVRYFKQNLSKTNYSTCLTRLESVLKLTSDVVSLDLIDLISQLPDYTGCIDLTHFISLSSLLWNHLTAAAIDHSEVEGIINSVLVVVKLNQSHRLVHYFIGISKFPSLNQVNCNHDSFLDQFSALPDCVEVIITMFQFVNLFDAKIHSALLCNINPSNDSINDLIAIVHMRADCMTSDCKFDLLVKLLNLILQTSNDCIDFKKHALSCLDDILSCCCENDEALFETCLNLVFSCERNLADTEFSSEIVIKISHKIISNHSASTSSPCLDSVFRLVYQLCCRDEFTCLAVNRFLTDLMTNHRRAFNSRGYMSLVIMSYQSSFRHLSKTSGEINEKIILQSALDMFVRLIRTYPKSIFICKDDDGKESEASGSIIWQTVISAFDTLCGWIGHKNNEIMDYMMRRYSRMICEVMGSIVFAIKDIEVFVCVAVIRIICKRQLTSSQWELLIPGISSIIGKMKPRMIKETKIWLDNDEKNLFQAIFDRFKKDYEFRGRV